MRKMKNPIHHILFIILWSLGISAFTSCSDQRVSPIREANQEATGDVVSDDSNSPSESISKLPQDVNFLQQGARTYVQTMNLYRDFKDSFLIRGNEINTYLASLPVPTAARYCMLINFPALKGTGNKSVLAMAAKVKSFKNFLTLATEYYLQVEVSNSSLNTNDCATSGIVSTMQTKFGTSNFATSIAQLCPTCTTAVTSSGINLFAPNGVQEKKINIAHLSLGIIPGSGDVTSNLIACSSNATCTSEGFNCCLQGQCVKHGEVKNGVDKTSDEYLQAINDILQYPQKVINYTNLFYVCPELVSVDPDNNPDDGTDVVAQAADLFVELQDLYRCVNPQLDEFSICAKKYTNASESIGATGTNFSTSLDDLNFSTFTNSNFQNIYEITYGGSLLYRQKFLDDYVERAMDSSNGNINAASKNDSLTTAQSAFIKAQKPIDAKNDTITMRYLIDGTCERISTGLAKCFKYYTQGQSSSPSRSSDHSGSIYVLPSYANTSYNIIVEVEGIKVAKSSSTWSLTTTTSTGKGIVFNAAYPILPGQDVVIQYFVSTNVNTLLASKEAAQASINAHCACDSQVPCNLKPDYSQTDSTKIVSYSCSYQQPDVPEPPLQKQIYLSAKTVPHKFYDEYGVYYPPEKIKDGSKQELTEFSYIGTNTFKPNNLTSYIGFNEIYGNMKQSDISPMPAQVVEIVRGRRYDLFVDEGTFSTCLDCGSDYYTNINRLFPHNFEHKGAGYFPDNVESRRVGSQSIFRSDDLLFGRACFVPATMIPWTHVKDDDVTEQRRNRLQAQHFMFANGYNRDWYGFDYGSIIGSFDGVTWFSVGNQRRIQANSNRLFLAVNAYFGDLTTGTSFKVTISEISTVVNSGSFIDHDTKSDGAQCQVYHYCENDNDCLTQLGYDYVCANIGTISTPWPTFDTNGIEISGSVDKKLVTMVGGSNGQINRCVYRGRGAACEPNYNKNFSSTASYSNTDLPKLNMCSPNNYCADINTQVFNTKINRIAQSPLSQNNNSYVLANSTTTDIIGLGSRLMGRPYKFYGDESAPADIITQLTNSGVDALCVPGKTTTATSYAAANKAVATKSADKILNIGRTPSNEDANYYAYCPGVDDDGNYNYVKSKEEVDALLDGDDTTSISKRMRFSIGQNVSTNLLAIPAFDDLDLFNDEGSIIQTKGYNKNSCMRAPGASCFTDLDCAPNRLIGPRIRAITDFLGMNESEANFWKEELVCARERDRYVANFSYPDPFYTVKDHTCCRETSKTFTLASQPHLDSEIEMFDATKLSNPTFNPSTDFSYINVPGQNIDIDDEKRYSRINSLYPHLTGPDEELGITNSTLPPLFTPAAGVKTIADADASISSTRDIALKVFQFNQFLTIQKHNEKMCCSGHWVRNLAEGNGGGSGGHRFSETSFQNWDLSTETFTYPSGSPIQPAVDIGLPTFRFLSWMERIDGVNLEGIDTPTGIDTFVLSNDARFFCNPYDKDTSFCEIRHIPEGSEFDDSMNEWFGKFELLGIPQVLIETPRHVYQHLDYTTQKYFDGQVIPRYGPPIHDTFSNTYLGKDFYTVDISERGIDFYDEIPDVILTYKQLKDRNAFLDFTDQLVGPGGTLTDNDEFDFVSAANIDAFAGSKKQVFSSDSFSCCLPTGYIIESDVLEKECCTGLIAENSPGRRCCLDNYTDLSVYTNLYVSSEGMRFNGKVLKEGEYNPNSGYINPELVMKMAPTMCCSGVAMTGRAIHSLYKPLDDGDTTNGTNTFNAIQTSTSRRWVGYNDLDADGSSADTLPDSTLLWFRRGVRWTNHVYCVPSTSGSSASSDSGTAGSQQ